MKIFLAIAILLPLLIPVQINAWWPFGPSNFDDCVLKYQKEAKCERASYLINYACNCKFDPGCSAYSSDYNPAVWDCILENIGKAQNDRAANAISYACFNKYKK